MAGHPGTWALRPAGRVEKRLESISVFQMWHSGLPSLLQLGIWACRRGFCSDPQQPLLLAMRLMELVHVGLTAKPGPVRAH